MDYFYYSAVSSRSRSCWSIDNAGPPMRYGLKGESEGATGNLSQNSGARPVPCRNRTFTRARGPVWLNRG